MDEFICNEAKAEYSKCEYALDSEEREVCIFGGHYPNGESTYDIYEDTDYDYYVGN